MSHSTNRISAKARYESYQAAKIKAPTKRKIVMEILQDRPMTALEVAHRMVEMGCGTIPERNLSAPRLTELMKDGLVEVKNKKVCPYSKRGVSVFSLTKEGKERVQTFR